MSTILVTGASGLIGNRLTASLAQDHEVIAMSRRSPDGEGFTWVRGDFAQWEDLAQLDQHDIDAVVHLAAVTGGCLEREGMLVNVEGTRALLQYLASRGCKKMVLASSIATIGIQREDFVPEHLPITESHPCHDRDGYGFSKHLMEETTRYLSRQKPELDIVNIRLSSATTNTMPPGLVEPGPWRLGSLTHMIVDDAVRLFALAVEAPATPGLRIVNGVASQAWSTLRTADQLRHWYGDQVDLSFFETPGNEYASPFDASLAKEIFGFEATATDAALEGSERGGA